MNGPDVSWAERAFSPNETYTALYDLAYGTAAEHAIVELGTFYGASAIALGQGARDGSGARVWSVDPHDLPGYRTTTGVGTVSSGKRVDYTDPRIRESAERAIERAGLAEQVTLVQGFSEDVGLSWSGPGVGLLYIDGDHRQGAVRRDYAAWERRLIPEAMVVFDDYRAQFPGVIAVVAQLVEKGLLEEPYVVGSLAITRRLK